MGATTSDSFDGRKNLASVSILKGNGGLQKVRIASPNLSGEIYLHGAHVTSWKPAGKEEVLFLSSQSRWQDGHAIRGGVPICFPWFGGKADDPKAPAHGFVRTRAWQLGSVSQVEDGTRVSMFTESSQDTKRWWPNDFHLAYHVTFSSELGLELVVTNTGKTPFRFEEALHAYHRVKDIRKAHLKGLDGVPYLDKTDSNQKKIQTGEVTIASETDRVYLGTTRMIDLVDPGLSRHTRVQKENSLTTVIWSPWAEKAHSMPDIGPGEWDQMICIETSNVADFAVDLAPGEQHTMKATISARDL